MFERVFNHSAHRRLWNWLSNNPGKFKDEWPGWKGRGGEFFSSKKCFACDVARTCLSCPLDWDQYICSSAFSHFSIWNFYTVELAEMLKGSYDEELKLATQMIIVSSARSIRDLPLQADFEGEVI